jgi:hypothetical protein
MIVPPLLPQRWYRRHLSYTTTFYCAVILLAVLVVLYWQRLVPQIMMIAINDHNDNKNHSVLLPPEQQWAVRFAGENFVNHIKYDIDRQIDTDRAARQSQNWPPCAIQPLLYEGEFGTELRVMVPWAYYLRTTQQNCTLHSRGAIGTKYLYYFSDTHEIIHDLVRHYELLPKGNPFGVDTPHIRSFPEKNPRWRPPPFRQFFTTMSTSNSTNSSIDDDNKPMLFISNKYRKEWRRPPVNFLSVSVLRTILTQLTPYYHIVYKRHTGNDLKDVEDIELKRHDLRDKEMIIKEFPDVVLFEQLLRSTSTDSIAADPEDENLLMFTLMATSVGFISVQGGLAVASSYFGGHNVIFIKRGEEIQAGSYDGYFFRFSNANITWKSNDDEFIAAVETAFL